ncbi:c-type cytochrome [Duganella sp. FT80W]|uniref:C-type cytochrome n=1 Tax=Duganella guangzhouensis TaxID=2666084 RepID=A0A6I2L0G1_9BURK|nr:di-heme oxidoredictase family protein [Duganella guangzhouensis]MRW91855.1 c-type cytochrome [Duganella guangzhouensis]
MRKLPYRQRSLETFQRFTTTGLPLAISLTLAACGGGSDGTQDTASAGPARMMSALAASPEAVLTPVAATASGAERGDLSAAAAIDHDLTTRWSSLFSDTQWLTLDYGSSKVINHVHIDWENAHATQYQLQVSDDNLNWTTIKTVDNSQGGSEDWTGLNGQGRYLRMQGVKRSTNYGYSIFEIQAYSGGSVSTDPVTTEPVTVDPTKPGVAIKPVTATSSALENPGNSATNAIDGSTTTRWASAFEDGAWIQFDFGAKTQVGYMKLLWENAYAKQYNLLVSDDGQAWTQIRSVSNGLGGTEEFFNLGVNARYIRLQGVARATQYGYSLFEVSFKTPGSDNSLSSSTTSAFKFPASGAGWAPLPAAAEPLESLQFTLADGTLVTRFGARGLARHGRERGEEWNEIGYGLNETVDPVTGLPVDKGPGNYLTFVPQYFKNRTWGMEIIDNSRVAGVTKPQLIVNQYSTVDFLQGGVAFFRAIDRPGVTGYGWMAPGQLVDDSVKVCKPIAYPANNKLATTNGINGACTLLVKEYPGMTALDTNGFPIEGKNIAARPLVQGDVIEVSPSMFSTTESMLAKGDNGGIRYYSYEWVYVVGQGLKPWYGVQPRLNSVPLPAETLSGGLGSVSYNYSDNALFMFQQPQTNVGMQNMQRFVEGRRLFHTNFTTGDHNEPGNDRYDAAVGLQGQLFNQSSCFACHVNNGRSVAPTTLNQRLDSMSVRVASTSAAGVQSPHPLYGTTVQMNALSSSGTPQNWGTGVRVGSFESTIKTLADGSTVELRKPVLAFEGPVPDTVSLRAAQPIIGAGLLEAVAEADILARATGAADVDGVKGVANYVYDPESGAVRLGRFGWKASKATLRQQAASALLQDMSVVSPVYRNRSCNTDPAGCQAAAAQKGITEDDLQALSRYLALVAVPAQRSLASGFPKGVAPIDEMNVDPVKVAAGAKVFTTMRCSACHTVEMKTGSGHLFAELRNQTIRPYSDLLLHDMGTGLADKFVEGQAKGNMWRTAPLWGIGYTDKVMGNSTKVGYLHDGRARNLTEAVMWHDGEAAKSRQRFENLSKTDREALLAFLKSL